jgi:microcystin degradation protein MlrC
MSSRKRVAIVSVIQETNTFAASTSTFEDFVSQGLWLGEEISALGMGLNIEISGSIAEIELLGHEAVPIVRAWAMSGGILAANDFDKLLAITVQQLDSSGHIDGMILHLHGALVSEIDVQADAGIVEYFREQFGANFPIVVTHDLHANLSKRLVHAATAVIGFRTYPHIDQAETGIRAAQILNKCFREIAEISTVLKKLRVVIPAEAQATSEHPMAEIRALADSFVRDDILDISLFPVQPWLDVPELGFGITVTHRGSILKAERAASLILQKFWELLPDFQLEMFSMDNAVTTALINHGSWPIILVQSSDSPTSGSTGDDGNLVQYLTNYPQPMKAITTLVDGAAVKRSKAHGIGEEISLTIGFSLDRRWGEPFKITGIIKAYGDSPVTLEGPVMTGQIISMGSWVRIAIVNGCQILITERPAPTFDPSAYHHVGVSLKDQQIVHVRSALLFKSGYEGFYEKYFVLDLAGPSTANLKALHFQNIKHPTIPFDEGTFAFEELIDE